ncbi:hypothetical protein CH252_00250 [Rhodococcus sp. 06-1477-1B]|nr:hypothetical protein CH252_00250 [Rhodococcus sp. 06-1477-1B]
MARSFETRPLVRSVLIGIDVHHTSVRECSGGRILRIMMQQGHSRHIRPGNCHDGLLAQALQHSLESAVLEQYSAEHIERLEGVFREIRRRTRHV